MVHAVKSLVFQVKSCRKKKRRKDGGKKDMCLCVLGGVLISPKIRNKFEIEDAVQMSPILKPWAIYLGRFRYLSSVLQ